MNRASNLELGRDEIVETLRRHRDELQRLGVTSLSIFGSRARGDHRPDSDLDLLIDYDRGGFSLIELVGVQQAVESLTGFTVQVITRSSLSPKMRAKVDADETRVF